MKTRKRGGLGLALGLAPFLLLAANCGDSLDLGGDVALGGQDDGSAYDGGAARSSAAGAADPGDAGRPSAEGGRSEPTSHAGEGGAPSTGVGGQEGGNQSMAGMPPVTHPAFQALDCRGQEVAVDEDRVRLCVLLSSCTNAFGVGPCVASSGPLDIYGISWRTTGLPVPPSSNFRPHQPTWPLNDCALPLDSCADVLACAGFRLPIGECEVSQAARCEGELAINCDGDGGVTDCQRTLGVTGACHVTGNGADARARCTLAEACTEPSGTESCQGSIRTRCVDGVVEALDCAEFGLGCEQQGALAACVTPLPSETCDTPNNVYCQDGSPTMCNRNGVLFQAPPCNLAGDLSCGGLSDTIDRRAYCVTPGCAYSYDEPSFDDHCEGDDYVSAVGFESVRVHCPAYGFTTCGRRLCTY